MRRRPQRVRLESSGALMSPPPALSRSGVRLIALVLVVISLWLLVNFIGQVVVAARMDRQIADKQAEMTQIEAANAALKDHVAYAESPAYAEQIAREQLGYAREGDTVILPTLPDRLTAPEMWTFWALIVAITRPVSPTIRLPSISTSPSTEPSMRMLPSDLSVPTKLVPGPTTVSGLPLSAGGGPTCDFLVLPNIDPPTVFPRWNTDCVECRVCSHFPPSTALTQFFNRRAAIIK